MATRGWIVALLAAVGAVMLGSFALWALFGTGPGWFHRQRLEAVVAEVRRMHLPPCATCEVALRLDDLSDLQSLHERGEDEAYEPGAGRGRVWARRTEDGNLTVVIETRDCGHAGNYGFAFSDGPLKAVPFMGSSDWFRVDVPGHLYLVARDGQIDEHWWSVLNNLD